MSEYNIDDVRASFSGDLEAMLTFEETSEGIVIKPKQFLGSDNFAKIASIIRSIGGEYVSAGKDSRFVVGGKVDKTAGTSSEPYTPPESRIIDLAHFTKDRKFASSFNIDEADDGGLFVAVTGNGRPVKGGKTRVSTKLNEGEISTIVFKLLKFLLK